MSWGWGSNPQFSTTSERKLTGLGFSTMPLLAGMWPEAQIQKLINLKCVNNESEIFKGCENHQWYLEDYRNRWCDCIGNRGCNS